MYKNTIVTKPVRMITVVVRAVLKARLNFVMALDEDAAGEMGPAAFAKISFTGAAPLQQHTIGALLGGARYLRCRRIVYFVF
jgi:hypothetical protein